MYDERSRSSIQRQPSNVYIKQHELQLKCATTITRLSSTVEQDNHNKNQNRYSNNNSDNDDELLRFFLCVAYAIRVICRFCIHAHAQYMLQAIYNYIMEYINNNNNIQFVCRLSSNFFVIGTQTFCVCMTWTNWSLFSVHTSNSCI